MESVEKTTPNSVVLPEQQDLSQGVIVILSGGPVDWTNPIEVRTRMDQIIPKLMQILGCWQEREAKG